MAEKFLRVVKRKAPAPRLSPKYSVEKTRKKILPQSGISQSVSKRAPPPAQLRSRASTAPRRRRHYARLRFVGGRSKSRAPRILRRLHLSRRSNHRSPTQSRAHNRKRQNEWREAFPAVPLLRYKPAQ